MPEHDFAFRANKAKWLKILLEEELPVKMAYLYGSVSKPGWDDQDYTPTFDDDSDYDFAVSYHPEATNYLNNPSNGWTRKDVLSYQDKNTVGVYEKQVRGFKVQVSERYDLGTFIRAWDSIPSSFYWKYINKRSPTAFPREDVKEYLNQLFEIAQRPKTYETVLADKYYGAARSWGKTDLIEQIYGDFDARMIMPAARPIGLNRVNINDQALAAPF